MTDLNFDGPEWTTLTDPSTGESTPVKVRVYGDAVFIAHESGGTLVNIEVVANGDGEQVVRTFVANPAVITEDEHDSAHGFARRILTGNEGFVVIDTDVAAGGYTG